MKQNDVLQGETLEINHGDAKKGPKDDFLPYKNETVDLDDMMDLNESVFWQASQLDMENSVNQLQAELENATCNKESSKDMHLSERLEHKSEKNSCVNDSISSGIKNSAARNSTLNTIANVSKCKTESGFSVCERKVSHDGTENSKAVASGGRTPKNVRLRDSDSSVNVDHSNDRSSIQEVKTPTNKHLKHLNKATCNGRQNKENIQNFREGSQKTISTSEVPDNNLSNENLRAPHQARQNGHSSMSASHHNYPKTPLAMPSPSSALEIKSKINEAQQSIGIVGEQSNMKTDNKAKSHLNFRLTVNEEVQKQQGYIMPGSPQNTEEETENIVLKSPFSCKDSQGFISTQEKMELSAWGLPETVLKVMWNR